MHYSYLRTQGVSSSSYSICRAEIQSSCSGGGGHRGDVVTAQEGESSCILSCCGTVYEDGFLFSVIKQTIHVPTSYSKKVSLLAQSCSLLGPSPKTTVVSGFVWLLLELFCNIDTCFKNLNIKALRMPIFLIFTLQYIMEIVLIIT